MNMRRVAPLCLAWMAALCVAAWPVFAQEWRAVGPHGGDVRLLVADPQNAQVLYLGTSDGHIFHSTNGGAAWQLLSRVGDRPDTVVMSLLVDRTNSSRLYAGTRTMKGDAGGFYASEDRGRTWKLTGLRGQTVRALAQSHSRSEMLVAGTLDGVYRSADRGHSWERISPAGHGDLLNFDSVAIDRSNPEYIYAGTYHLAWKTADGGRKWVPIHSGMIDDSDVMDISIDYWDGDKIFATACSGMYRSANRGDNWTKIRGVPAAARRTYFLRQDPRDARTLYAGTTQGLWKSTDDGLAWKRLTPAEWSVISLVIDPTNPSRLVAGTERRGVMVSDDAGATFRASNKGFYHQQVMAFAMSPERPERMLLVLTNAEERIVVTRDAGQTWNSLGAGLKPEHVRRVFGAPDSWWASLTSGGLMAYDEKAARWLRAGLVEAPRTAAPPAKAKAKKTAAKAAVAASPQKRPMQSVVNDLAFSRGIWLAATQHGLMASRDRGATWSEFAAASLKSAPVQSAFAAPDGIRMGAVTSRGVFVSPDGGQNWRSNDLPVPIEQVSALHSLDDGTLILATRWGLFVLAEGQTGWQQARIPDIHIEDVAVMGDTLLASTHSQGLFASADRGSTWVPVEGPVSQVRFPFLRPHTSGSGFIAASSTEGLHSIRVETLRAGRVAQGGSTNGQTRTRREEEQEQQ